jgi:hypothetical protein
VTFSIVRFKVCFHGQKAFFGLCLTILANEILRYSRGLMSLSMVSESLVLSMLDGISISILIALRSDIDAQTPRMRLTMLDIQTKW